jgi:hypothetical protein
MIKLSAQIILAARSDDVEGWMNVLVVVLLAVFWAIWGVLKARAKKNEAEKEEEEPSEISKAAISQGKGLHQNGTGKARGAPKKGKAGAAKIANESQKTG